VFEIVRRNDSSGIPKIEQLGLGLGHAGSNDGISGAMGQMKMEDDQPKLVSSKTAQFRFVELFCFELHQYF
jgi:hypothetical protein